MESINRKIVSAILTGILLIVSNPIWAKEYSFYVSNPAGSASGDAIARKIAEIYNKKNTKSTLVVVNVPGGNHTLAVNRFKQDSLAVIVSSSTMHIYNYLDLPHLSYTDNDFNHVAELGELYSVYYTYTGSPIQTIQDLVTKLPASSLPFIGSHANNTLINVRSLAHEKASALKPISFKSPSEMLTQVLGKHLMVGLSTPGGNALLEMVAAGKIKLIGSTANRLIVLNGIEIPSVSQALNIPQFNGYQWVSITPGDSEEHRALAREIQMIVYSNEFQKFLPTVFNFPSGRKDNHLSKILSLRQSAKEYQFLFRN